MTTYKCPKCGNYWQQNPTRDMKYTEFCSSCYKKELKYLLSVLEEASLHLDFCGYGDSYEKECARDSNLEQHIEEALKRGNDILENKCP